MTEDLEVNVGVDDERKFRMMSKRASKYWIWLGIAVTFVANHLIASGLSGYGLLVGIPSILFVAWLCIFVN